jgi:hypothetical protein
MRFPISSAAGNRLCRAGAALALLLLLAGSFAIARSKTEEPGQVSGKIYDAASRKPLVGVEVVWKDSKTYSDKDGLYRLAVPIGVRKLVFHFGNRPEVDKSLVIRESAQTVTLDVLVPPVSDSANSYALVADRGLKLTPDGKALKSEFSGDSMICTGDERGNNDRFLQLDLGGLKAHSPVWTDGGRALLYGKEGVAPRKQDVALMGVYRYDVALRKSRQIASGQPIHFVDVSATTNTVVAATDHAVFVVNAATGELRKVVQEPAATSFLLSIAWGPDGRIYFAVDESVPIDAQHSYTRSRIASVMPDGSGLQPAWAADPQYSFRYPISSGNDLLYSRFTLDGKEQTLWSRPSDAVEAKQILANVLRAVSYDPAANILYYLYRNDLHFRDLKSNFDVTLLNSVESACLFAQVVKKQVGGEPIRK